MTSFSSTKSLITSFAKSYGFDIKILEARLQRQWPQIVGRPIASHTRPDAIKFRKLFLLAENSAWLQQLVFLKPMILEKVNRFAAEDQVTDIVLRIGDVHVLDSPSGITTHPISSPVTQEIAAIRLAHEWTASIKQPELRDRLADVIAKALSLCEKSGKTGHADRSSPSSFHV